MTTEAEVRAVRVRCPTCGNETSVEIPVFLVKEAQDGVLKVQIPQGAACPEHSFMAYIDKKFSVRGYQNVDIEFTPELEVEKPHSIAEETTLSEEELRTYDVQDMITGLGSDIVANILRTILVEKPILFLESFDLQNRIEKSIKLLEDMESEDLVITGRKITKDQLKDKNIRKANGLVLVPMYRAIMSSPFLEEINTRFESNLLKETTLIPDRKSQIIFIRKELIKITMIIDEFVKMLEKVEKIYEEDIPAFTQDKFNYKLESKNIDVIKEIIDFKYSHKLAQKIINKSLDKIRTDLW
ncbi:MAG: hypothetical protein ACFFCS_22255 [Candidatus Hodarchaeota archaeon]